MTTLTNDLEKGAIVRLRNGMRARIEDNKKGNIRLATVYGAEVGWFTEMGSIYAHDIALVLDENGKTIDNILLTAAQKKLRRTVSTIF